MGEERGGGSWKVVWGRGGGVVAGGWGVQRGKEGGDRWR